MQNDTIDAPLQANFMKTRLDWWACLKLTCFLAEDQPGRGCASLHTVTLGLVSAQRACEWNKERSASRLRKRRTIFRPPLLHLPLSLILQSRSLLRFVVSHEGWVCFPLARRSRQARYCNLKSEQSRAVHLILQHYFGWIPSLVWDIAGLCSEAHQHRSGRRAFPQPFWRNCRGATAASRLRSQKSIRRDVSHSAAMMLRAESSAVKRWWTTSPLARTRPRRSRSWMQRIETPNRVSSSALDAAPKEGIRRHVVGQRYTRQ